MRKYPNDKRWGSNPMDPYDAAIQEANYESHMRSMGY
jgi:hypothetical protein